MRPTACKYLWRTVSQPSGGARRLQSHYQSTKPLGVTAVHRCLSENRADSGALAGIHSA